MASFFHLTLDTTPPILQIFMPTIISSESDVPITISSSENIAEVVRLYIIDSQLKKENLIFQNDGNELIGTVHMNYPIGFATLYCQVKDDVGNLSTIAAKMFSIRDQIPIDGTIEIKPFSADLLLKSMVANFESKQMLSDLDILGTSVDLDIKQMSVFVSVDD